MSGGDWQKETRRWFKEQANSKLIIAAAIFLFGLYVFFGFGYSEDYHKQVNAEIKLAKLLCENSLEWIMADPNRLKLGQGDLRHVTVKGRKIKLEHVKYPKVIYLDSGIRNLKRKKTVTDLYCVFKDPRSTTREFFYKYDERLWVDKVRFHR
ncbi:MAG: hypothetical protein R3E13_02895 [Alphaproteobacteria bacterium]